MGEYRFGFSWIAVIIFALPMVVNILWAMFPAANVEETPDSAKSVIEMIEQMTRILYLIALVFIVSSEKIEYRSVWLMLALLFLVLYYIVWIRYFTGGRDVALMSKSFLLIPIPLAVFPVLYFIFAAIWLHNYIAVGCMVVFGISHYMVSYREFH